MKPDSIWQSALIFVVLAAPPLAADTFRLFGSAGAETRLTPPSRRSPLNPGNVAGVSRTTNLCDATLFLDRAAEDRAWKLHFKLRGEASDRDPDRIRIGEAAAEVRVRPWLTLAAGRTIEKWGTGYAWNPTAFLSQPKDPSDAGDRRSTLGGRDMVRADLAAGGSVVSLYALRERALAARAYRLVGQTDVAVNAYAGRGDLRGGLSLARVFGDALELHAEAAVRRASRSGSGSSTSVESVVGGQITLPRNVNVVLEWSHDGRGLSAAEWDRVRALAVAGDLRRANAAYTPLKMARNYGFVRLFVPLGRTDLEALAIVNLRDGSALERLAVARRMGSRMSVYVIHTEFTGGTASELASVQIERSTVAGVRLHY